MCFHVNVNGLHMLEKPMFSLFYSYTVVACVRLFIILFQVENVIEMLRLQECATTRE